MLFRHLLVDVSGNTHRAEICIDKLFTPEAAHGRQGVVELRAFEMPPHVRMAAAQMILIRTLLTAFAERPYQAPLTFWLPWQVDVFHNLGQRPPAFRFKREVVTVHDVFPISGGGRAVVIEPLEDVALPDATPRPIDDLIRRLPAHCIVKAVDELPQGVRKGDATTYAQVMSMWEQLHAPFLAAADMQVDPIQKIEAYRKTQRVDYGCELAHQKAADVARELAREKRFRAV